MSEETKKTRQWYQKKRYIIPLAIFGLGVIGVANTPPADVVNDKATSSSSVSSQVAGVSSEATVVSSEPKPADNVPIEYKSALSQANSYSNTLHLSKKGVYDQLVSEYGGQFTSQAAQYAIDNLQVDWNANALKSAKSYQDTLKMSPAAIRDQLISDYGGKFTPAEADYAIANLDK